MSPIPFVLLAALAQPAAQPAVQPATQPQPKPPAQPEPSLDELLGLPQKPAKPADPAAPEKPADAPRPADPARAELERQLSPGEVQALFDQAVVLMDQTALRLTSAQDTGLSTQRMQEDVIRKLDTLIDEAKKQQSKSRKSKPNPQQQQQPQQSQPQQSSQQNAQNNQGQNPGPGPAMTEGNRNASPGGSAAWGNLPAHIRDALSQGKSEQYSSRYKLLTEKYYKRLAEEPKPGELPRQP